MSQSLENKLKDILEGPLGVPIIPGKMQTWYHGHSRYYLGNSDDHFLEDLIRGALGVNCFDGITVGCLRVNDVVAEGSTRRCISLIVRV